MPDLGLVVGTLFWLASDWNIVYAQYSPKIAFCTFSPWGVRLLAPQRTVHGKKIAYGFALNPCLVDCFLRSNSTFLFLVPPRRYFLPLFATPTRLRPHTRVADKATTAAPSPSGIPSALGTKGRYAVCKSLSCILLHAGLQNFIR